VEYDDPRMVRTADAINKDLCQDGLILRYRLDQAEDGLVGEEGTFLACSFWLAECFAHQGRIEDARRLFDRAVSSDNDLGLFAEEYDPATDQLLGNFPQGLTHLAHISAAVALKQLLDGVGDSEREAHL
jgi:pentatricopeptide repeat protein